MRRSLVIGIAVLAVAGFIAALYQFAKVKPLAGMASVDNSGALAQRTISIDGHDVIVDIADTPALQELGLGGRDGLQKDHGMLFVFPSDDYHAFWMKDMHFAIDMVWLSFDGHVVAVEERVSPDTFPKVFRPNVLSRYVLELDAGASEILNLHTGNIVRL